MLEKLQQSEGIDLNKFENAARKLGRTEAYAEVLRLILNRLSPFKPKEFKILHQLQKEITALAEEIDKG